MPLRHPIFASGSDVDLGLAAIVVLGIGAMWLATRLKVPSILLLLGAGVAAGPGLDIVDPDELLGDLLFPAVSLAVGILLFEGGLGLRYRELEKGRRLPILRLVTVGVLVTWLIGSAAAFLLFDISRSGAVLLGSILVVSGPTVVIPLLRFARVREPVNGILRWEGIFIDPIGATLAIVVLDAVIEEEGATGSLSRIASTAAAGTTAGVLGALVIMVLFRRHLVPDNLQNAFTLMMVVAAFAGANLVRAEAGLFATTVMGVVLANQQFVPIGHIREFEENLGSLILASLFVILGARVDLEAVQDVLGGALVLVAILVLVARPVAVYVSTVGSGLSFQERSFLACMAPRGIVAAAVSALFAIELSSPEVNRPVDALVPVTFVVIVGTVAIYGLGARLAARRLRMARPAPNGIALIGGPPWALRLGEALSRAEVPIIVVTTDPIEAAEASERGMLVYTGRLDADDLEVALDGVGVAQAIALSRYTELNAYGIARLVDTLGRANVFYLPPFDDDGGELSDSEVLARRPFARACTQQVIDEALANGGELKLVSAADFDAAPLENALPLVTVDADRVPSVDVSGKPARPADGAVRLMLTRPGLVIDGEPVQEGSAGSSAP